MAIPEQMQALEPPRLYREARRRHLQRRWQGIPGIERTPSGRLWATWYSGGEGEGPENFVLLSTSADDGETWAGPCVIIDPPGKVRAFDPCLWHDPGGRLWLFWAQSHGLFDGRCGVWAMVCEDSESGEARWSAPRRLCHGIMMNKPTVLSSGVWLLPAAIWPRERPEDFEGTGWAPLPVSERVAGVLKTADGGVSWEWLGGADIPGRSIDEHMLIERRDSSVWMLIRMTYGIGQSISTDGGRTWTGGEATDLGGPDSRFFLRRLSSGALLLVNHYRNTGRSHLTALVSDDDGRTWGGGLLLDERDKVSYPDGVEDDHGRIWIVHDHDRYGEGEILLSLFTEADVRASGDASGCLRLRQRIDSLTR